MDNDWRELNNWNFGAPTPSNALDKLIGKAALYIANLYDHYNEYCQKHSVSASQIAFTARLGQITMSNGDYRQIYERLMFVDSQHFQADFAISDQNDQWQKMQWYDLTPFLERQKEAVQKFIYRYLMLPDFKPTLVNNDITTIADEYQTQKEQRQKQRDDEAEIKFKKLEDQCKQERRKRIKKRIAYQKWQAQQAELRRKQKQEDEAHQKQEAEERRKQLWLITQKAVRKDYYQKRHDKRYEIYQKQVELRKLPKKIKIVNLLKTINKIIKQKQEKLRRQEIKENYYTEKHNQRYMAYQKRLENRKQVKKPAIFALTKTLNIVIQKQTWLEKQKKKVKPFPNDAQKNALNFNNLNLFEHNHKIIYLFLGINKEGHYTFKVGRSTDLIGREYLYAMTSDKRFEHFKQNQTILLYDYFLDENDSWTKGQYFGLEGLFRNELRRNAQRYVPNEWYKADNKKLRKQCYRIFRNVKNTLIKHPEIIERFEEYGYSHKKQPKAVNRTLKHDLAWLLKDAQKNNKN